MRWKRGSRSFLPIAAALLLAGGFGVALAVPPDGPAQAPATRPPGASVGAPSDGLPQPAWLWLTAQMNGDVSVSLAVPSQPVDSRAIREGLDRLLPTHLDLISRFNDDTRYYAIGHSAMQRQGLRLSGDLDFRPLAAALATAGIEELRVAAHHPPSSTRSPAPIEGMSSDRWVRFTLATAQPPAPWRWTVGFGDGEVSRIASILGLLLALPLMLLVVFRWLALRDPANPSAWFRHWQQSSWVVLGIWIVWPVMIVSLHVAWILEWLVPPSIGWLQPLLASALYTLAPASATLAAAVLGHAVSVRLRGTEWSLRETVSRTLTGLAAMVVPFALALLGASMLGLGDYRGAVVVLVLGLVIAVVLLQHNRRALEVTPHAVTTGPLRDRIFELAARAGVKLRQIYVLPMRRSRMANAFAVRGETVMLTDLLLENLTRREVDAVMAHEITHLQKHHPQQMAIASALIGAVGFLACTAAGQLGLPVPFAIAALALAMVALLGFYRHNEGIADAGAVQLTGDPEATIRGLARLGHVNRLPDEWSHGAGLFLTHPSTAGRARAIGRAAHLSETCIAELLRAGADGEERYELPPLGDRVKVFSTPFKMATASRNGLILIAVTTMTPAFAVQLARGAGWTSDSMWLVALGGLALTFVLLRITLDVVAVRPYAALRRRLFERMQRDDLDVKHHGGAFVGFAPGPVPRVYEGFYDWDIGFLFLQRERLVYVGEETRFTLQRADVEDVTIIPGGPGWIRAPRILVRWAAGDQSGTFQLRPGEVRRVSRGAKAAHGLLRTLRAWQRGEAPAAAEDSRLPEAGPPKIGTVTSVSPRAVVNLRTALSGVLLVTVASLVVCVLFDVFAGGELGVLYVVGAAWLGQLAMQAPFWRWKDRTDPLRDGSREISSRRAA